MLIFPKLEAGTIKSQILLQFTSKTLTLLCFNVLVFLFWLIKSCPSTFSSL